MAKVYVKGKYIEMDPMDFPRPHEDVAYMINGRRYKFVLCHWEYGGVLRGYNTNDKKWFDLYDGYVQKEGCMPIGAEIVMGGGYEFDFSDRMPLTLTVGGRGVCQYA